MTKEATKGALARANQNLAAATAELMDEKHALERQATEQADKEKRIAQVHQVIGRVQANMLMSKFADVGSLVWLKEVKETKLYRDLPEVGTWDNFCKSIGLSRQKVDEDLQNLAAFGEEFLLMGRRFSLGYQDLRKLRQIQYDGESFQVIDDGKTVIIEGEVISLDEGAAPLVESALEKLLVKNKTLADRNKKLEKDFKGALKEEIESFELKEKTYQKRIKELEQYEPNEKDREWCVKQMETIEEAAAAFQIAVSKIIIDPRLKEDRHLQAKVHGHVHEAYLSLQDLRTRLDEVIDMFND